ncbi:tRNA (guanosine(37)-N1)-methyltransferase TrmD [Patescibacteria group bacterium]|nr:tRNA (guanosine(37)-N1)-methyltransferase TrmD [Patescibacteria group bacterium]MBU2219239.1 tRNA (guanosine(37)-N1)-methyltransferase TrmD [Patescibacteria group bacterium]MBU2263095.1 tRNA (guanosine(37)-N1)-methyltransferase TrmD [Patescibacteria group bacterium]
MVFHLITIFPESLKSYFDSSILKRAQKKKLIKINIINIRDFTKDKHKITDDRPYGGGAGMVMKIKPILNVIKTIRTSRTNRTKFIILSPAGKQFDQKMARDWAKKYKNIILISGHYEGIDERVKKILKAQEISVGPYVLTGGELPAGIIIDSVSRHIPGVLGKKESLEENRGIGIPVYTRPEVFEYRGKKYRVPKILLSGHHKKIEEWRKKHRKI